MRDWLRLEKFQFGFFGVGPDERALLAKAAPGQGTAKKIVRLKSENQIEAEGGDDDRTARKARSTCGSREDDNGQDIQRKRKPKPLDDEPYHRDQERRPGEAFLNKQGPIAGSVRRAMRRIYFHSVSPEDFPWWRVFAIAAADRSRRHREVRGPTP